MSDLLILSHVALEQLKHHLLPIIDHRNLLFKVRRQLLCFWEAPLFLPQNSLSVFFEGTFPLDGFGFLVRAFQVHEHGT